MIIQTSSAAEQPSAKEVEVQKQAPPNSLFEIKIGLLTGCQDRPYAFGLAMALAAMGVGVEVIGGDEQDSAEFHTTPGVKFLNLRGSQKQTGGFSKKLAKLFSYYAKLMGYARRNDPAILHILWNNKFETIDRTALMLYYKMCGKKIALTAHNVNQARRDGNDSLLNRITLRIQYHLADQIFVHTEKMKEELCQDFGVDQKTVTVIRHPINDAFPDTALTSDEAKKQLGIGADEKTILFFGRLRPYKGLELLIDAYEQLISRGTNYRLVIASEPKKGSEEYLEIIEKAVRRVNLDGRVISRIEFIPDQDMELYLKSADVLVLPYKEIFQSGVLFLSYAFGLPVVCADVGSFREEIVEGETGFLCRPNDATDLAKTIDKYFESDLYRDLATKRPELREYARKNHSWEAVAEVTRNAYEGVLKEQAR